MKKITLIIILLQVFSVKAQVGIGTISPEATLDIKAQSTNATNNIEGILIPRVSKNKAYQMATNSNLKESTMIYVDITTDYAGTDREVKQIEENGFYFWDGNEWVTIGKNIYNSDGEITEDRDIDLDDNELTFNNAKIKIESNQKFPLEIKGDKSNDVGISINNDGDEANLITTKSGDFKINLDNKDRLLIKERGGIGMGTNSPEATLDIKAQSANTTNDIEGLLVPRVSKDKAYKMAMNGTKLKESTMIYVDDMAYTGTSNPRINKITKKGYYFWRDNEWTAEWNTDSRNIFNSNGDISEERTVTFSGANKKLNFKGGQVFIEGDSSSPLIVNSKNSQGGGLAIHPDDLSKKVEFKATKQGDFQISAGGDHLFIKRGNGNVGISTNDPKQKLDVRGGAAIDGRLGIGTTEPQKKLDVRGDAKITGNIEVTSSIRQTSDRKFKERIQTLGKGMSYILALNPVTYFWNEMGVERGGDKDIQQIGFIAQEVEEILPNAVGTDSEGNKSVNYIQMIPILTKAVQELKAENEMLKEEIQKLTEKVTLIEDAKN